MEPLRLKSRLQRNWTRREAANHFNDSRYQLSCILFQTLCSPRVYRRVLSHAYGHSTPLDQQGESSPADLYPQLPCTLLPMFQIHSPARHVWNLGPGSGIHLPRR